MSTTKATSRTALRVLGVGAMVIALPLLARCTPPSVSPVTNLNLNNTAPVARAGSDADAPLGVALTLNGTASYDPDGDELLYHWEVDDAPDESVLLSTENPFAVNGTRNSGVTSVVPDQVGVYIFALVVEDPSGALSDKDYVVIEVTSTLQLPVADAGSNATTLEGTEVCVDGSASWDPSGRTLTYGWTMVATPPNSDLTSASLTAAADVVTCFTPDAPGTFTLALVVENGLATSEPDFVFVASGSTNQGPVANASILEAASCSFVQLTGAASTDPEGDDLNYSWDLLLVPQASGLTLGQSEFDDATSETPAFYADVPGRYTVQLVVDDGEAYSTPRFLEMVLEQKLTNTPPVVTTTSDAYFFEASPTCSTDAYGNCTNCPSCSGKILEMNAEGSSDPDGDPIDISWQIVSGPSNASLFIEDGLENSLNVPGPPGSCTSNTNTNVVEVQVTATDCSGDTGSRIITVVYDCG
jgi:hypothetical protein